jgi:undecaprenyl-diphosphatase
VVASSLFLGGIVLVFIDKWLNTKDKTNTAINYPIALKIGLFQVLAMIPGVSRSAATIIGGLTQNLSRQAAAEFSFFLAVPTMFAATVYKLYKFYDEGPGFQPEHINLLIIGNVVAFIVAALAIKTFIGILNRYGFKAFGYYRIVVGAIILILYFAGIELTIL